MNMMPNFPIELVANVIKNFGCSDLLNARFISSDWNREIRRFFKNTKFQIYLVEENSLEKYIEFENEYKSGYILPFHIKFSARSLNFEEDYLEKFVTKVDSLVQMFGNDCVHALHFEFGYRHDQTKYVEQLITLLEKLATGLKRVQFDGPQTYVNTSTAEAVRKLRHHPLTLPNVTEVEVKSLGTFGTLLCWLLIQKCPNIKELNLLLNTNNANINEISSLPLVNVTTLVIYSEHHLRLLVQQVIRSQTPLRLTDVTFIWNNYTGNRSAAAIEVLCLLCETLKRLKIMAHRYEHSYDRDPIPLPFTAGKIFPRLTSLIIQFNYEAKKFNDLDLVIDPSLFPALTYAEFPHNVNLQTQNTPPATATEFPTVKTLTLYAENSSCEGLQVFPYKKYAENYLKIFPNVTQFQIIKGIPFRSRPDDIGGRVVRQILQGLIQSEVATSAKIEVVKLFSCPQNYLGEVLHHQSHLPRIILDNMPRDSDLYQDLLNALQSVGRSGVEISDGQGMTGQTIITELAPPTGTRTHMTNVRKVGIIAPPGPWSRILKRYKHIASLGKDKSKMIENLLSKPVELHVDVMLKNLPKLEEINISSVLLGTDADARVKLVQDFKTHHPNLKLNIV